MRLDFIHLEFGLDCEAWVINTTLEPGDWRGWDENMRGMHAIKLFQRLSKLLHLDCISFGITCIGELCTIRPELCIGKVNRTDSITL